VMAALPPLAEPAPATQPEPPPEGAHSRPARPSAMRKLPFFRV
jgi:hypothetical protein